MEQSDKKSELLSLVQEEEMMTCERRRNYVLHSYEYGRSSEHVSNSGVSGKIRVLLSELPLTIKERHRLLDYTNSFLYPCG